MQEGSARRSSEGEAGPRREATEIPRVRVFVSSPGDVEEERVVALGVVRRLQAWFQGRLVLVPILWEQEPLLATAGFQREIDRRSPPSVADVAVFVLWSRLGSPLSEDFALADGRRPTGTEWEFDDAFRAAKRNGLPHMLVYRKRARPRVDVADPDLERYRTDFRAVERFFLEHFRDTEDTAFEGSYHAFDDAASFGRLLEQHLEKLLAERLASGTASPTWHGTPFRGLEAFGAEHAPVFFGRSRAIQEVRHALARQVAVGRAFVLILGPSGDGKSSLARAGLLPLLDGPWIVEPGVDGGTCRRAILQPGGAPTPLRALVDALLQPSALPDLAEHGDAEELTSLFAESPRACVSHLRGALKRVPTGGPARLVLLVDQLEEVFTHAGVTESDRGAFFAVLDALARSGDVYVLATLRNDFYRRVARTPVLMALKEGSGQYDLPPVDAAEATQIVLGPADVAGLAYEVDAERGQGLDTILIDEATRAPDALPLLEYTLTQLEERKQGNLLTFAAYEALGGFEGAIATRAEAEWEALDEAARRAFPSVLRALVEVGETPGVEPTRRRAPLSEAVRTPGARALVERFVAARLLVVEGDGAGAVTAVAHDALLRAWPRMAGQIEAEADLLRTHRRVRAQARRWSEEGRDPSLLLPAGKPLSEAASLRAAGFPLTSVEGDLLEASEARARRSRRLRLVALTAIGLLSVGASLLALLAVGQRQRAVESATDAGAQRDAKTHALEEVLRLAASKGVRDLLDEEPELWPVRPDRAPALADWIVRAKKSLSNRGVHRASLDRLLAGAASSEPEGAWRVEVLETLLEDLETISRVLPGVERRHEMAGTLLQQAVGAHADAWHAAARRVAASDHYAGLELAPQVGLVPLGPDPASGLEEFAHLGSGPVPERAADTGSLLLGDECALVLVLLPGGRFPMGAQSEDAAAPNYDAQAEWDEVPVRTVALSPFLLAKYECTQAQWMRLAAGANPSRYRPTPGVEGAGITTRHPVELVPWTESVLWSARWRLRLPTEAEWEYACRAGTTTPYATGSEAASLQGHANIADGSLFAEVGGPREAYTLEVDDAHGAHAPVGSFTPNAFGLHDMHGNVFEWCADGYSDTYDPASVTDPLVEPAPNQGRIYRGGAHDRSAPWARSANRDYNTPGYSRWGIGFRPACTLQRR